MATLTDVAEWVAGIYRIEQDDPVLGGEPNETTKAGLSNIPHLHLAKRTAWLRQALLDAGISGENGKLVTSLNSITTAGFFQAAAGAAGSPDGTAPVLVLHIPGATSSVAYQLAMRVGTVTRIWVRRRNSATWGEWLEVMHSGNVGTAAQATLQSSAYDRIAGRVLTVGAFGLGADAQSYSGSLDDIPATGFYRVTNGNAGGPSVPTPYDSLVLHIASADQKTQLFLGNGDRIFTRLNEMDGSGWRPWLQVVTGNRSIEAGLGLAGGGDLGNNVSLSLALGELPPVDASAFALPRFVTIDGNNSETQGRSTSTQMRAALGVYSQGEVDALLTGSAIATKIAARSLGDVGTYAFLRRATANNAISKGDTYAGSALRYAGVIDSDQDYKAQQELADNTAPSGTWRAMGSVGSITTQYSATLFLRIS